MILRHTGNALIMDEKIIAVGGKIIVTDGDYTGLKGYITEIRTDEDLETENEEVDVYCSLEIPETEEKVKALEEYFSSLYGTKKNIGDICLDMVILAPEEISRVE